MSRLRSTLVHLDQGGPKDASHGTTVADERSTVKTTYRPTKGSDVGAMSAYWLLGSPYMKVEEPVGQMFIVHGIYEPLEPYGVSITPLDGYVDGGVPVPTRACVLIKERASQLLLGEFWVPDQHFAAYRLELSALMDEEDPDGR